MILNTLEKSVSNETQRKINAASRLTDQQIAEVIDDIQQAFLAEQTLSQRITDETTRATNEETSLNTKINNEKTRAMSAEAATEVKVDNEIIRATEAEGQLSSRIANIENSLPNENEITLADKKYVDDKINALSAYYICRNAGGDPFENAAQLKAAETYYSGGKERIPTQNDYAIVLHDESAAVTSSVITNSGIRPTTRYIYIIPDGDTIGEWQLQYVVNNTGLSSEQISALNSGITKTAWDAATADIEAIKGKITSSASALNQLMDKAYVDNKLVIKQVVLNKNLWSQCAQTVNVAGISSVETDQLVFIDPKSASRALFIQYEIEGELTSANNQIKFTYDSGLAAPPEEDITVYVSILDMKLV